MLLVLGIGWRGVINMYMLVKGVINTRDMLVKGVINTMDILEGGVINTMDILEGCY
ncbi:hypothetical protein CWI38_0532p0030 [Hamiltosporidium tvaerminnensis]|uniref:Uncharacterized protein n=1 Tax=Hamiltosporidium tvaerminnensis TaxID=1176355 RepID=A0A4Q9LXN9_9MICR|nr:hypothetical protein CWI38_0532p0030 [Hamiltosporidium tvaerminnensis]